MSSFEIIVLSFIQALTEFLPVSSSGHLIILPRLFGWADQGLEMDVAVHVGTLCAVMVYFWQEISQMIAHTFSYILSGFKQEKLSPLVQLSFTIIVATIPAVIFGYILKKYVAIPRSNAVIGFTAIFFGILLYGADQLRARYFSEMNLTLKQGLLIGLAQAIALIPGTSRSGICMTAARLLGYDRLSAARFAFLLSIPAILGAAVLTGCDAVKNGTSIFNAQVGLAVGCSFVFGLVAIKGMLSFISKYSLTPFVIYRIALGILLFLI